MPFLDTWNTAYEGLPADNENINLGAGRIRDLKTNIRERLNIDHSFGDTNDSGKHIQVTLPVLALDPSFTSTDGGVYTKTVAGNTELFYKDNAGRVVQLTSAGAVDATPTFPSGTVLIFGQAAPPSGWTQIVTANDALLRIVNDGSGGAGGGSWTITGLTGHSVTLVSTTTTTTLHLNLGATATVNSHALTVSELPSHSHNVVVPVGSLGAQAGTETSGQLNANNAPGTTYTTDGGTGGGGGHTHGASATAFDNGSTATSVSSSPAGTSTTVTSDGTWRPAYVNVIAASKN